MRASNRCSVLVAIAISLVGAARPLAFEVNATCGRHARSDRSRDHRQPIPVVLSVRTNVSADDEAWITGAIRDGLDLWNQT